MKMQFRIFTAAAAAVCAASLAAHGRFADPLRFSEIFFDSPGTDVPNEYIEIRGVPNTNLDNHYIIILEAEGLSGSDGFSGSIDAIFDLSGKVIGTNGFALFRQFNSQHQNIRAGTADYRNTNVSIGFGTNGNNSIGFSSTNNNGQIENGGFAAFLIRATGATRPALDFDLDDENDGQLDSGVDYAQPGAKNLYVNPSDATDRWEILDSIGQVEAGEALTGRGYAQVMFSTGPMSPSLLTAGAVNVNTGTIDQTRDGNPTPGGGIEPEYIGRWGGSTGFAPADYVVANVTDNPASGFMGSNRWTDGYRVSGNHASRSGGEFFRGFLDEAAPYGAVFQNTLGRVNYPIADGDLSQDETIDQIDLDIVLDHWLETDAGRLGYWFFGDAAGDVNGLGGDGTVNQHDLDFVLDAWPAPDSTTFTPADMKFLTGDTDLSGSVDFNDLLVVARNFGANALGYRNGDFDHNGVVDFTDLLGLARRFGLSWFDAGEAQPFGDAEYALLARAGIVVPEPATIVLFAVFPLIGLQRRR